MDLPFVGDGGFEGSHDENGSEWISVLLVELQRVFSLVRCLQPRGDGGQIVGAFVEIAVVEVVLVLEE